MILNSTEKLVFDKLVLDGITFTNNGSQEIPLLQDMKYLKYLSKDSIENHHNCDYVIACIDGEYVGSFIGESILNATIKAYAGIGQPLYSVKALCAKEDGTFKTILKYIENLTRAREQSYIEFNRERKEYEEFYSKLKDCKGVDEIDDYIIDYPGYNLKRVIDGSLEIRKTYSGEEYDLGKGAPLRLEAGETNLGYIESNDLRYSYDMDYLVCYDNAKSDYLCYCIGKSIRVTDSKTYNCYFIKDFFIYEDSDYKYEIAKKMFDYLTSLCIYRSCKYIKIKTVENSLFSYFYDYCKITLGMQEKDGYLTKKV